MRTIFRTTGWAISLALTALTQQVFADSNYYQNNQQFGVNLPQAALPSGSDEIRTTDGSTCRSAVGGDGAYLDVGVVGAPQNQDINATAAAYGRIVIPLGSKSKRIDCSRLYDLEIQRLKMELELARMGASGRRNTDPADFSSNWANEGWDSQPKPAAVVLSEEPAEPVKKAKKKKAKPAVETTAETPGLY